MTVMVDQDSRLRNGASPAEVIEIGLVNSMPDAALEATERQFVDLVQSAAGELPVRLRFFSLPDVPRGERGRRHVEASYGGIDEARNARLDALIVTGTEPRAAALSDEPYWPALAELIDWAEHNTISTIWSCLAAHAAVLHLDGIERYALAEKCFGLFACAKAVEHPLTMGLAAEIPVPHSRWNELREDELAARGYQVLTRSPQAGVDAFSRQGRSLFVFFQGHPEYDAASLLGEYRRDFARFARRESETCPLPPRGYFDAATTNALMRLRASIATGSRSSPPARRAGSRPRLFPEPLRRSSSGAATTIHPAISPGCATAGCRLRRGASRDPPSHRRWRRPQLAKYLILL